MLEDLWSILGHISSWVISGAAGAALLRVLGGKWLENAFAKDLETYKTRLIYDFDLLLTRKTKWHEREYDVLSTSWIKLIKLNNKLLSMNGLRLHTSMENLSKAEQEAFFEREKVTNDEKSFFLAEKNKNTAFNKILDSRLIRETDDLCKDFGDFFEENKIFLSPDIKEKFASINSKFRSVWVDKKISYDDNSVTMAIEAKRTLKNDVDPLIKEIEELIQQKLFPNEITK